MNSIIFIREKPNIRIYKLVKALKQYSNFKAICICRSLSYDYDLLNDIFDEVIYYSPAFKFSKQFDLSFNKRWNKKWKIGYRKIIKILDRIQPTLIHTMAEPYNEVYYIMKNTNYPVILDANDFTGISVGIENLPTNIRHMEKYCFENANGICHKGAPYEIEYYRNFGYTINCPVLDWPEYCDESLFPAQKQNKLSNKNGELHIVYTGGISNNPKSYNHQIALANIITKQKLHFHIYPVFNETKMTYEKSTQYLDLEKNNKYFHFHRPCSLKRLTSEISKYDWGLWIHPIFGQNNIPRIIKEKSKVAIGNKLFSYLEAGLPIIISQHLEYGKYIVQENKVGIVIDDRSLSDLAKIIKNQNLTEIQNSVLKTREKLSIRKNAYKLVNFYETVLRQPRLVRK